MPRVCRSTTPAIVCFEGEVTTMARVTKSGSPRYARSACGSCPRRSASVSRSWDRGAKVLDAVVHAHPVHVIQPEDERSSSPDGKAAARRASVFEHALLD